MATLPADLDAVTSLPTTVTANVTTGHTSHSEIIHKALRAIELAWASLAEVGALDAEAIRDLMAAFIVGSGLVTVTHNDAADTLTIATTATANSTDAFLRDRANHTGTQDPATTLTAWVEAVVDAAAPALVSGVHTGISFAYDDASGRINATVTGGGGGGGPITANQITDSTTVGRNVLTAIDAAAARGFIGAGTSNLAIGTSSTTAKAGNYQPTAANISDGTTVGRSLITATDAAAARLAVGLNNVNNVDLLDDTTNEILPAFIPFGSLTGEVAEGNHAHPGALINVYNAAGTQLTAAPAIQFMGDAQATYNSGSQRVEVNVPNTLSAFLAKSSSQNLTSASTTLQDITTLQFETVAATNYDIVAVVKYQASTTANLQFNLVFPPGSGTLTRAIGLLEGYNTAGVWTVIVPTNAGALGTFRGSGATHEIIRLELTLFMGDAGGTFKMQAAQATSHASTPVIYSGSNLKWFKV